MHLLRRANKVHLQRFAHSSSAEAAKARVHALLGEMRRRYPHLNEYLDQIAAGGSTAKAAIPPTSMLTLDVHKYVFAHTVETPAQKALAREVEKHAWGMMSGSPDEARFLAWLVETLGIRKVVEVGVFMGYTTLTLAQALPAEGHIVALDISEEFTSFGKKAWAEAGVANKVDLRLGPAVAAMDKLIAEGGTGKYDLVFIDADKPQYDAYYERALQLLRPGGVVVVDNVLWDARVTWAPEDHDEDTRAIHALNQKIYSDPRVSASMLAIADGVTLCRKL